MIIAVHEVELHISVNSDRSHAKSVLGVADFTPSESRLLGSGAWCGESSECIHGPGKHFRGPLGAVGIGDGRGQGETTGTGIVLWFCWFDVRETEDRCCDSFGVLHDRTASGWREVAQLEGLIGWRIWQPIQFYLICA